MGQVMDAYLRAPFHEDQPIYRLPFLHGHHSLTVSEGLVGAQAELSVMGTRPSKPIFLVSYCFSTNAYVQPDNQSCLCSEAWLLVKHMLLRPI